MSLLLIISIIFICCLILNVMIIKTKQYHGYLTNDLNKGPQKIHSSEVPRIGSLPIFISLFITLLLLKYFFNFNQPFVILNFQVLIIISIPAIIIGLLEDLFKDISISARLITSITVGVIASYWFNISLPDTGLKIIDQYTNIMYVLPLLTIFFFAGLINSINLIDGIDGLAGITSIIILFALSRIAVNNLDFDNYFFINLIMANIFGFIVINWFTGTIFLGDAGAYLLGVILAFVACQVLSNNNISLFNILLIFCYPIWEISYSIIRRALNGVKIMKADNAHLHSLMYIVIKNKFLFKQQYLTNFLPTLFLIPILAIGPLLSIYLYDKPKILVLLFLILYIKLTFFYKIMNNIFKRFFNNT